MIEQRNDKKNYLDTAIFIALFFLIVCFLSKNNDNTADDAFRYESAYVLNSKVTVLCNIQQFSFQKSVFPIFDNANFSLFSENIKIITYNRLINQQIVILQKNQLSIKPISIYRFYYQYYYPDTEDLPILS